MLLPGGLLDAMLFLGMLLLVPALLLLGMLLLLIPVLLLVLLNMLLLALDLLLLLLDMLLLLVLILLLLGVLLFGSGLFVLGCMRLVRVVLFFALLCVHCVGRSKNSDKQTKKGRNGNSISFHGINPLLIALTEAWSIRPEGRPSLPGLRAFRIDSVR
jgi:hypothetical protein